MEEKKKRFPHRNDGGHKDGNGQRISVRPGNFAPPADAGAARDANRQQTGERRADTRPAPADDARRDGQKNGDNRQHGDKNNGGNGGGRNRRNRRNRNRNRRGDDNRNQQQGRAQVAPVAPEAPAAPAAPAPRHDKHDRRDRRDERHGNKQPSAARTPSDSISASLQSALDGEFSTPTISPFTSSQKPPKAKTAVDTDEFAVDIATAAYLIEDIPCGFPAPDGNAVEVVGVRFRKAGKVYFFAPNGFSCRIGEAVLVDTARGEELGEIVMLNRKIAEKNVVQPLRAVLRRATEEDLAHDADNRRKEREALKTCAAKIAEHKLDMKLVDAQYTFDNSKLLFYFTSEGRVDFRDLVRDLAGIFRTRIELRQIGIRDESRLIGGLGMCGRPFCCATFLSDFGQVSIKMAKEQGLSINASKISGCCGRLMCCLRYENETYAEEARRTPKKDTPVDTPDGKGVVVESTPLAGLVKVRLDSAPEEAPRVYHRDDVTVLAKGKQTPAADAKNSDDTQGADAAKK